MRLNKNFNYFAKTVLLCLTLYIPVQAQEAYPSKQIHMVLCCVGAIDAVARAIADEMSDALGQAVVVEPRPGAGGGIAANHVAKAKNDGYTILVGTNATHAANQSLYLDLPYDYVKDFSPIGGIGAGAMVLLVPATSSIHTVAELTEKARREPGKLTYGWAGTTPRIAMALYSQLTHTQLREIPYKTNPQATTDLIGGEFDTMFADLNTSAPLVKAGKLHALAVSGLKHASVLPNVPTMQEAGVGNYSLTWWVGMWAPAGTPQPIVKLLNRALTRAISSDRLAQLFLNTGANPMPMSPDELMKFQIAENRKWAEIVKNAGITPQ